jgi:hypothetical protein
MMKPAMLMGMIQSRSEIVTCIARGKYDKWIARKVYNDAI